MWWKWKEGYACIVYKLRNRSSRREHMLGSGVSLWDLLPSDLEHYIQVCVSESRKNDVRDQFEVLRRTEFMSRFEDVELTAEWHDNVRKVLQVIEDIRVRDETVHEDDEMNMMERRLNNCFGQELEIDFSCLSADDWDAMGLAFAD